MIIIYFFLSTCIVGVLISPLVAGTCVGGYSQSIVGTSVQCTPCTPGTWAQAGSTSCNICPANTYSLQLATSCTNCTVHSTSFSGQSTCVCDPNFVTWGISSTLICSNYPTGQPSRQPTGQPSRQPSIRPTGQPSGIPTTLPIVRPTSQPSGQPTIKPSNTPTTQPSSMPSRQPSMQPTTQPSCQPSCQPTDRPSMNPTGQPSSAPTVQPTIRPTILPSLQPTSHPTGQPTGVPTRVKPPTSGPTNQPSSSPTAQPFGQPSSRPTAQPSSSPTKGPTSQPTALPSCQPSALPTMRPTSQPSAIPSRQPSSNPTTQPSSLPTEQPTSVPTANPSSQPTNQPSMQPTSQPSSHPTTTPTSSVHIINSTALDTSIYVAYCIGGFLFLCCCGCGICFCKTYAHKKRRQKIYNEEIVITDDEDMANIEIGGMTSSKPTPMLHSVNADGVEENIVDSTIMTLQTVQFSVNVSEITDTEKKMLNHCLILIKPHCDSAGVKYLVDATIAEAGGRIVKSAIHSGSQVRHRHLVDKHFARASKLAKEFVPENITISKKEEDDFQAVFGESWASAIERQSIYSAKAALEVLSVDAEGLRIRCNENGQHRIGKGLCVSVFKIQVTVWEPAPEQVAPEPVPEPVPEPEPEPPPPVDMFAVKKPRKTQAEIRQENADKMANIAAMAEKLKYAALEEDDYDPFSMDYLTSIEIAAKPALPPPKLEPEPVPVPDVLNEDVVEITLEPEPAPEPVLIEVIKEKVIYVLNGYYLSMTDLFYQYNARIHAWVVEWDGIKLSWDDFMTNVIGDRDPSQAKPTSIRGNLYLNWKKWGLTCQPTLERNVIHASASAFEALAERLVWLDGNTYESDAFGLILNTAFHSDRHIIYNWLTNPIVGTRFAFEYFNRCDTNQVLNKAKQVMKLALPRPVSPNSRPRTPLLKSTGNPYKLPSIVEKTSAIKSLIALPESTLLYLKPHASNNTALSRLQSLLACKSVKITRRIVLTGQELKERKILEKQYPKLLQYATGSKLGLIKLTDLERIRFEGTYFTSWKDAIRARRLYNAYASRLVLGYDNQELAMKWNESQILTLSKGFNVTQIQPDLETLNAQSKQKSNTKKGMSLKDVVSDDEQEEVPTVLVLNGFVPQLVDEYESPQFSLTVLVVEWDGMDLSWEQFNQEVVGDKDPSKAMVGSIRGDLFENWEELWGLPAQPTVVDNGLHSSSSAFAALAERMIYFEGTLLYTDMLGSKLLRSRFRTGDITYWLSDPVLATGHTLFDSLRGKGTEDCIEFLASLNETSYRLL